MKERNSKKAYKRAFIGLFAIVIMALVAMFGVSFAAGLSLKDQTVEEHGGSAELTTLSGAPITVTQTTTAFGLYTLPTFTIPQLTSIQTISGFVDMTDDVNIGEWVPYAAKVSAASKKGDEVAYLKTFSGDRIQVNSTNAILTIDGAERAFASSVPDGAAGRRLARTLPVALPVICKGKTRPIATHELPPLVPCASYVVSAAAGFGHPEESTRGEGAQTAEA